MKTQIKQAFFFLLFSFFIANCHLLFSLDFNIRPKGFVSIPAGEGNTVNGNDSYSTGGGGELGLEADISTVLPNAIGLGYTFGIEAAMLLNPLNSDPPINTSFYSFAGVIGLYYFPLSRLFTRIDSSLGVYISANEKGRSAPGFYWRLGGEVGYRFTPFFTLAANAGWKQFQTDGVFRNSGLYAGLTAQLTFQAGSEKLREGVNAQLEQIEPVYPLFMRLYQNYEAGAVVLHNNENAEIRDVRVFFRASGYTASEFLCETIGIIPRGRSVEIPLLADFSPDILRFTDNGRITGELVIRYNFLGQKREVIRAVTVATHNRNTFPLGEGALVDPSVFAAFVSPDSLPVLDFSRFIAGLERVNRRAAHNNNLQYAIWLLEGLRASQVRMGDTHAHENEAQFPAETLARRIGTHRDLAILFAACLEAVGISAAFIQTENDFLVAVSLNINQGSASSAFRGVERLLIINNNAWLPLSMKSFNQGFGASWREAVVILNKNFKEAKNVEFIVVQNAWAAYPPAPLPDLGRNILRTDNNAALNAFNREINY